MAAMCLCDLLESGKKFEKLLKSLSKTIVYFIIHDIICGDFTTKCFSDLLLFSVSLKEVVFG